MTDSARAKEFVRRLRELGTPEQAAGYERSLKSGEDDEFVGVRTVEVFALAKEFVEMAPAEIEERRPRICWRCAPRGAAAAIAR